MKDEDLTDALLQLLDVGQTDAARLGALIHLAAIHARTDDRRVLDHIARCLNDRQASERLRAFAHVCLHVVSMRPVREFPAIEVLTPPRKTLL
jgi:hypothetical protein